MATETSYRLTELKKWSTSRLISDALKRRLIHSIRPTTGGFDFFRSRSILSLTKTETRWFLIGLLDGLPIDIEAGDKNKTG